MAAINAIKETIMGDTHKEGKITKMIEQQTAKVPSGAYLTLAVGSVLLSLGFASFSKKKDLANFLGLWAPTLLIIGLYNKIVKLEGSEG
jgi:hypothetical protein